MGMEIIIAISRRPIIATYKNNNKHGSISGNSLLEIILQRRADYLLKLQYLLTFMFVEMFVLRWDRVDEVKRVMWSCVSAAVFIRKVSVLPASCHSQKLPEKYQQYLLSQCHIRSFHTGYIADFWIILSMQCGLLFVQPILCKENIEWRLSVSIFLKEVWHAAVAPTVAVLAGTLVSKQYRTDWTMITLL